MWTRTQTSVTLVLLSSIFSSPEKKYLLLATFLCPSRLDVRQHILSCRCIPEVANAPHSHHSCHRFRRHVDEYVYTHRI
ncbi:hypothetical protein F4604DRAFT_1746086 [Suillus subluteus]|nr:hypothetical protein F4604DRAFT_1746086 [Suillus subluteus]